MRRISQHLELVNSIRLERTMQNQEPGNACCTARSWWCVSWDPSWTVPCMYWSIWENCVNETSKSYIESKNWPQEYHKNRRPHKLFKNWLIRALLFSTKGFKVMMYCSFAYDGLFAKFWSILAIYSKSVNERVKDGAHGPTNVNVRRGCFAGMPSTNIYTPGVWQLQDWWSVGRRNYQ